jgi:hypothetical protein
MRAVNDKASDVVTAKENGRFGKMLLGPQIKKASAVSALLSVIISAQHWCLGRSAGLFFRSDLIIALRDTPVKRKPAGEWKCAFARRKPARLLG